MVNIKRRAGSRPIPDVPGRPEVGEFRADEDPAHCGEAGIGHRQELTAAGRPRGAAELVWHPLRCCLGSDEAGGTAVTTENTRTEAELTRLADRILVIAVCVGGRDLRHRLRRGLQPRIGHVCRARHEPDGPLRGRLAGPYV